MEPAAATHPRPADTARSLRLVTISWVFGSVYFTAIAGSPVTLYADALGATPFTFGLLAAAPFAASLLSMPAAVWSDYTGRRKGIFMVALYLQRLMWLPIAALPPLLLYYKVIDGPTALGLFVGLVALMHCCGAIGGPSWMSWMADVIPRRVRGRYFARRRQFGILSALPAALLVGFLLDRFVTKDEAATVAGASVTYPVDFHVLLVCGGVFAVAALFGVVDIALFHLVPHDAKPQGDGEAFGPAMRRLGGSLWQPLKDRRFLAFAAFVGMLTFSTAPVGTFITLMLVQKLRVDNMAVQTMLLVTPMAASLAVSGLWGRAVDRFGKKAVLALASAGIVPAALGWTLVATHSTPGSVGWGWVVVAYVASAGGGIFWAGIEIANFNYVLDLAGTKAGGHTRAGGGGGYVAVNSVLVNVAGVAGGLTFGKLAGATQSLSVDAGAFGVIDGFAVLFLVSMALRVLAVVVFLPLVQEDAVFRHHKARHALRYITSNLYNNVHGAILQPVRALRVRPRETFRD